MLYSVDSGCALEEHLHGRRVAGLGDQDEALVERVVVVLGNLQQHLEGLAPLV